MLKNINTSLREASEALLQLIANHEMQRRIADAAELLIQALRQGGHIYSCGNGGSMCDAMHFAEELSGQFRDPRPALSGIAISDAAHMSCAANDLGFANIFSRFIEANGRRGDVLLGISTSGNSANVINAAQVARQLGMKVIALTGKGESQLSQIADVEICTPGGRYSDRIQELHIKVIHILIELIEGGMFNIGR